MKMLLKIYMKMKLRILNETKHEFGINKLHVEPNLIKGNT
jgi:hypothetical protein